MKIKAVILILVLGAVAGIWLFQALFWKCRIYYRVLGYLLLLIIGEPRPRVVKIFVFSYVSHCAGEVAGHESVSFL